MQEVVANVTNVKFDIEFALEQQLGAQPLPFPGMDKSGAAICTFYLRSLCSKGGACPFRHVKGDRTIVCKHWLRGLCKKGDDCEFLHEYDMTKMPECYFFSKFGLCSNKECPFLHIDPEKKIRDCPWYDRGFCRHGLNLQLLFCDYCRKRETIPGPNCKNRHVRRVICLCYLNGFCLEGPNCKFMHPKFDLPTSDPVAQAKKASIVCHFCGETGHKAANCPGMGHNTARPQTVPVVHAQNESAPRPQPHSEPRRPLDQVTCYKCGEKGHYANKCPKGHLAFLSSSLAPQQT